jgi:hypothetical protein
MSMRALLPAALAISWSGAAALAQDQIVASLPWVSGITAGPNGSTYEPPDEGRTLWIFEDFGIQSGVSLTTFESIGSVYPLPAVVTGVTARIYDALPPDGRVVLTSLPGTGRVTAAGLNWRFTADFGGQSLPAGSYWIGWTAATHTASGGHIAIFWVQDGPHAVGSGLPSNAYQWNPGGAWGYPNNIRPVPADLLGNGQSGVNFVLRGRPACDANCDGSTTAPILNIADFLCFQSNFAAGNPAANCDHSTTAPILNIADFLCFQSAFAAGCP